MPSKVEIAALFKLPPEKIIEYLKDKDYIVTQNWQELLERSENRAFTIAGVMKKDILKDAKGIIDKSIEEGKSFHAFQKEFKPRMQVKGWEVSTHRLKTIYRVNTDIAYSTGRYREQEAVKEYAPYWQYIAVMDSNTRPTHADWNGLVFKADDPFWDYAYPPNGFNCRCTVRTYTERRFERVNLPIEDSKGKIKTETVEIAGKSIKTKSYKGKVIDPGWDYNPGKEYLKVK